MALAQAQLLTHVHARDNMQETVVRQLEHNAMAAEAAVNTATGHALFTYYNAQHAGLPVVQGRSLGLYNSRHSKGRFADCATLRQQRA